MDEIKNIAQRLGIITVEDMEQYTALELIMMIANKMNDYSDELQYLSDKVQYLLNEGMLAEVIQIFDEWLRDGTFDTLINQSALKEVNERIDETNAQLSSISKSLSINIKDFPKLDDELDDVGRFNRALEKMDDFGVLQLGDEIYVISDTVNLPNKRITIVGGNSTLLTTTKNNIIFNQKNHVTTKFLNLNFTGNGVCINFDCVPSNISSYDAYVCNCIFELDIDAYAVRLNGTRESVIKDCHVFRGRAIYLENATNPQVINCFFRACEYGVFANGVGALGYSCGLMLTEVTILGCTYGVRVITNDSLHIVNCMIDYCDNPIQLIGQSTAVISNNFISSRGSNPAILIKKDDVNGTNEISQHIKIVNNANIICHSETSSDMTFFDDVNAIEIYDATSIFISGNTISFWTKNGIVLNSCSLCKIDSNAISNRSGFGLNSIDITNDDASNQVINNNVTKDINFSYAKVVGNNGYVTEESGFVFIEAGTTVKTIGLNLSKNPRKAFLTTNKNAIAKALNLSKESFVIELDKQYAEDVKVYWKIEY